MKIRILKQSSTAVVPKKATEGAAAYDVSIPGDFVVVPGRQVIRLGFALEIPYGYEAKIEPRSGFSCKGMEDCYGDRKDADVCVGKIDSDYRGTVGVIVNSHEHYPFQLREGARIAQMTIYKVEDAEFEEVGELTDTDRGTGGFGSTNN